MPGTVISRLQSSSDFASPRCVARWCGSSRSGERALRPAMRRIRERLDLGNPPGQGLRAAARKSQALAAQPAAQVVDQLGPRTDQRVVHPQIVFHSRERALGMCTEGRSILHGHLAQHLRVAPVGLGLARATPSVLTSVAGTTLTSCRPSWQHRRCERLRPPSPESPASGAAVARSPATKACRSAPRAVRAHPDAQAHLGFLSTQIDSTMVHGWFLLLRLERGSA